MGRFRFKTSQSRAKILAQAFIFWLFVPGATAILACAFLAHTRLEAAEGEKENI